MYEKLKELAEKYCFTDGNLHLFSLKDNINVCVKCNKQQGHQYSESELEKLDDELN